jgi:hypothetical protein
MVDRNTENDYAYSSRMPGYGEIENPTSAANAMSSITAEKLMPRLLKKVPDARHARQPAP